jgi:CheY-like chemotaxis protein
MSNLVLVVEDNEIIIFNMKLFLEMNNFDVLTAENGVKALDVLKTAAKLPDIIVSDIMMPEMDGYEFYRKVSENNEWSLIPFIFVSAKSSPEDIRLAKKLGVDDYITKPFEEQDLLAVIQGKIQKSSRNMSFKHQFEDKFAELNKGKNQSPVKKGEKPALFLMDWDERLGPTLKQYYPESVNKATTENIGLQLFSTSIGFYGNEEYSKADGTLIHLHNFGVDAYIFFDSMPDQEVRGNQRLYMLVFTAPRINYLEALRIRDFLRELAGLYRVKKPLPLQKSWEKITEIMKE